ncbi:FAD binding domain-containing protein [Metarhizium brunneum]
MSAVLESTGLNSGIRGNQSHGNCQSQPTEIPVLIVGGGPTGLLSAYMLSKLGVKSILMEKYPQRLAAPKAHALCPRSLEICRQFGLDTNAMRKLGTPRDDAYWVNFATNLAGECIGVLPYERMDAGVLEHTPEMMHNIPQPAFEHFIAQELENDANVEIQTNVAYVSSHQTDQDVVSVVEQRSTGDRWVVRSRHVLACDGAKSQVRKHLGIESEGEDGYETMMTIHFKANLRPVVGDRVGMLHWITDPACSGFIIAYDLGGNHVLINNFDSSKHPVETWSQELARKTVSAAVGREIPVEIMSYRPWLLSRRVAKRYRQGNTFLVGDAAHSFPPTGGLGLNSGIADAHNLAYKIAAVHHGWAESSILDTYEADRRQIALANSAQSVKNGKNIFSFLKALGTAGIDDVEEARANLLKSIHDPNKKGMIAKEIEAQREHFDNLGLHIGYVYGDKKTPASASDFSPKFATGARLPHAWIKRRPNTVALDVVPVDLSCVQEFGQYDVDARQFSTLDLVRFDSFALIVSCHEAWEARFEQLCNLTRPTGITLQLWSIDQDFDFVYEQHRLMFNSGAGFDRGGGVLVRPDQHLLGCVDNRATAEELESLIRKHLGK